MSNTASQTRTDGPVLSARPSRRTMARTATGLAALLLATVIISFRPFQPAGAEGEGGDILNQIGFGSLGALALAGLFMFVDRRVLAALLSPWWLLLLAFLGLGVMNALSPADSIRAALFAVIGIVTMAAVLTLPRDADSFSTVLALAGFTVLGFSYYGILAMPEVAIHGGDGMEPQHAGLWRGSFAHKNIAAPVMACLSFAGFYLWRRGWRWSGGAMFVLAVIFMSQTGSKTTLGTVPLAIILAALPGAMGLRFLTPALLVAAIAGLALATLGIVFIEPLTALRDQIAPDLTYTGRTALWAFMGESLAERPLTGYGFESFWGTGIVLQADQPFDRDWDIRGIVHGHNSYMDLAISLGLPALGVALVAFIIAPMRDFLRVPFFRENILLSELFMMMLTFTLLNAFLESFFFRRADPVWLFFVFAALGMRLVARFQVHSSVN
ncbi:O-antigen ligase family protein [Nitratireductor luteus]|uniref:O-antigen ligase family protein n=1 Tax=Nitratireductor luteus TaxID=2976980 RepID=UPI002240547A|nr:O-antigen ligase [Nitratireductor luteus]